MKHPPTFRALCTTAGISLLLLLLVAPALLVHAHLRGHSEVQKHTTVILSSGLSLLTISLQEVPYAWLRAVRAWQATVSMAKLWWQKQGQPASYNAWVWMQSCCRLWVQWWKDECKPAMHHAWRALRQFVWRSATHGLHQLKRVVDRCCAWILKELLRLKDQWHAWMFGSQSKQGHNRGNDGGNHEHRDGKQQYSKQGGQKGRQQGKSSNNSSDGSSDEQSDAKTCKYKSDTQFVDSVLMRDARLSAMRSSHQCKLLKSHYKQLAMQYHPDKVSSTYPGCPSTITTLAMQTINRLYDDRKLILCK